MWSEKPGAPQHVACASRFNGVFEYPLVLAIGCLVRRRPLGQRPLEPWPVVAVSMVIPLVICVLMWSIGALPPAADLRLIVVVAVMAAGGFGHSLGGQLRSMRLRWVFALLPLAGFGGLPGNVLFADRSFFGVLKVIDGPVPGHHVLQHGTTLHGRQDMQIATACEPLSYFHRRGPIGDVFAAQAQSPAIRTQANG